MALNVKIDGDLLPLTPDETVEYVGDDLSRDDFVVANVRHPDHEPEEYAAVGVDWLLESTIPGQDWLDTWRRELGLADG